MLQIDRNFLKDQFNLIALKELNLSKSRLAQCKALLNRQVAPTEEELQSEAFLALNSDTSDLYGLIHSRYIRSPEGKKVSFRFLKSALTYFLNRTGACLRKVPLGCLWLLPSRLL